MFVTTYAGPPPLFTHSFGWAKLFSNSQTYFKFHLWTYLCSSASVRCEGCPRGTMDFSDPSRNDHPEYDDIETTRLIATSLYEKGWCMSSSTTPHSSFWLRSEVHRGLGLGVGVVRLLPYFFCADFAHNPKFDSFNSTPNYFSAGTHMLRICHFVGYPNMNGAYLFWVNLILLWSII